MGDVSFLKDLSQPKPRNAVNVPKMIDDTVAPLERVRKPRIKVGEPTRREAWDFLAPFALGAIVFGGLVHLIHEGLFR